VAPKSTSRGSGKIAERDQLIQEHLDIVKGIAAQIYKTLPVHVELDDLIQAGVLGLLDAANKYDCDKQVPFPSYAKFRVRGAILDSLRKLDTVSRDIRRKSRKVETATSELRATLLRDPTETEIAVRLQIDVRQLQKVMLEVQNTGFVSSVVNVSDDGGMREREFESGSETRPDIMFCMAQLRVVLGKAMQPLRLRQQQVVRAYYSEHKTMKEIGLSLGINESRVSQLHKSALAAMRTALAANGVCSGGGF
jgi:RNA polymerase sigma factor for flagellar operon FliA